MIRFMSFSSGSCGNSYFLAWQPDGCEDGILSSPSRPSGILIDAGVSPRRLKRELGNAGAGFSDISAVLVSHDHMDHMRFLGSYCKRLAFPVYSSAVVANALRSHPFTSQFFPLCGRVLEEGEWNRIPLVGSPVTAEVRYFVVPHDATQTVGFAILIDGHRFVIITDCGRMTSEALEFASKADTLVIESNYDSEMLRTGPYTADLKKRICGGCGHMSNDECARTLETVWHRGLKNIFLCHLSENNNTPELAFASASAALEAVGAPDKVNLHALPRTYPSPFYIL